MANARVKLLICIQICIMLTAPQAVGHAKMLYRCHMCGMDAAKSQTEFIAHFIDGSSEHTCCLHCVYLLQNVFMKDRKISKLDTKDFATGAVIDAEGAYYLEGSSLMPKGSMAPFLLAFSEKETAERYAKRYKGSVLTFKAAMEIVARFDEEIAVKERE